VLKGVIVIIIGLASTFVLTLASYHSKSAVVRRLSPSLGDCPTQHCRLTGGREPKFQRPEGGRHGRRRDCRLASTHAAVADAGEGLMHPLQRSDSET
jgi:hypothetical protein